MREATRSRMPLLAIGATAVALVAAGCGSSSSSSSNTTGGGGSASGGGGGTASSAAATISTMPSGDLGRTILVDSKGNTVYLFEKDESDESYCNGKCAQVWPAVTTNGSPKASGAVDASKLGTLKRDDGTTQVTYAGHPLYTFVEDKKAGEAKGNESDAFGAEWYALEPSGAKAESGGESHGGGGKKS